MLNVELKYNLLGCPTTSKRTFCNYRLSIYVLHVEKELVGVDLNPLTANKVTYQKVETIVPTVLPASEKSKGYDYDGKIITKKGGVYLAFLDQGACVSLSSVIVSYNYCPEIGRVLVRFSRTAAVEKRTGHCTDINSVNKVKLSGVCLSNGEWNIMDGIKCLCKPSYELVNATEGNVQECSGMNGISLFFFFNCGDGSCFIIIIIIIIIIIDNNNNNNYDYYYYYYYYYYTIIIIIVSIHFIQP